MLAQLGVGTVLGDWGEQLPRLCEVLFAHVELRQHEQHAMVSPRDVQRFLQQLDGFVDLFVADEIHKPEQ